MFDTMKLLKWLGAFFMGIGVIATAGMIVGGLFSKTYDLILFALIWGAIFIGIGSLFYFVGGAHDKAKNNILEEGKSYQGIIYRHDQNRSIQINGDFPISVVVRYMAGGVVKEAVVPTMDTSPLNYPIGYEATIRIHDGKAAIVPGTVKLASLPDKDVLLDPSAITIQAAPKIGITCPHCGASINVPLGGWATCEFCNARINVDKDGHII